MSPATEQTSCTLGPKKRVLHEDGDRTVDIVQNSYGCINLPSSQTYRYHEPVGLVAET
jgi:hypothetical protein